MKRLKGRVINITQDGYAIIKVAVNPKEIMCGSGRDCYVTFTDDCALLDNQEYINLTSEQCAVVYNSKIVREAKRVEDSVCKMAQSGLHGNYAGVIEKPKKKTMDSRTIDEIEICLNCPFPDCKSNCKRFKEEKSKLKREGE